MSSSKISISRIYKVTDGSALVTNMTAGSPANGGSIQVEAHTDFSPAEDGETRTVVIGTEQITYTDVDEATDTLLNITRAANSTVAASHAPGDFVQAGVNARREKFADGFIDDDDSMSVGVEIPRILWPYYPAAAYDHADMPLASVDYLDDGHPIITDAPIEDDGPEGLVALQVVPYSIKGPIAEGVKEHQLPMPYGGSIEEVRGSLGVNGLADDDVILDCLVDGVSILTTKVTIPEGEYLSDPVEPTDKEHTKGQLVTIEVEQAGTLDPGSDPVVYLLILPGANALGGRIEVPGEQGEQGVQGESGDTLVGCKAVRTSAQTISTGGSNTAIQLNATDEYDTHGFHDTVTNNSRITIPDDQDGVYLVVGELHYAANGTGARHCRIHKNGTAIAGVNMRHPDSAANTSLMASTTVSLVAGDYIELFTFQSSGGNLNTVSTIGSNHAALSVVLVGRL